MTVEQVKQKLHTSKAKQGIHSRLPMGRQVFSHSQEIRALSHAMVTWEKKHQHSESPPHSSSPALYAIWYGILLCGQLSWVCPPTNSCAPQPAHWWLCKHHLAITKTSLCYQHCF